MNNLTLNDLNQFIYTTPNEQKILLDCHNYLSNKSRVPMHADSGITIPTLLTSLIQLHSNISSGSVENLNLLEYTLMDVLLVSELIKSPKPVRVLELGCENGILSLHFGFLLGNFNEESTLCCVCDSLGNDSDNQWLDKIAMIPSSPKLSFLAADFDDTGLEHESFDIVIINGSTFYEDPYKVIKEAERLTKKQGMLLCYASSQPLLESCFSLIFSDREEYVLSPSNSVMKVTYEGLSWDCEKGI